MKVTFTQSETENLFTAQATAYVGDWKFGSKCDLDYTCGFIKRSDNLAKEQSISRMIEDLLKRVTEQEILTVLKWCHTNGLDFTCEAKDNSMQLYNEFLNERRIIKLPTI